MPTVTPVLEAGAAFVVKEDDGGIDSYRDRQDLNVELLQHVRRAGGRVWIGTDAHNADELRFIETGIAAAITAEIPRERILNCMAPDGLVQWTWSKPH